MLKSLVLNGGGILGSAQAAMLKALEDKGLFSPLDFKVYVGTSVGALNALALAVGMPVSELLKLWMTAKASEMMPRVWWSIFRHKRKNLLDHFIVEKILKPYGFDEKTTLKDIQNKTGNQLYTVSTILQSNKALLFGPDQINISAAMAVKYSTSHPVAFDAGEFIHNGINMELTDGGISHNCPILVIYNRDDIDEVLCLDVNTPDPDPKIRYNNFLKVIIRILTGLTGRNETVSYAVAYSKWKENFKLWSCMLSKDYDIFDVDSIPQIINEALIYSQQQTDPQSMSEWFPLATNDCNLKSLQSNDQLAKVLEQEIVTIDTNIIKD